MKGAGNDHPLELLSALLDGELSGAERDAVESHAEGCEGCRAVLADLRAVDGALDEERVPPLPAGLAGRIVRQAGAAQPPQRVPRPLPGINWFRLPLAAAAAMAGLLALWIAFTGMEGMAPGSLAPGIAPEPSSAAGARPGDEAAGNRAAFRTERTDEEAVGEAAEIVQAPSPARARSGEARQEPRAGERRTLGDVAPGSAAAGGEAAPGRKTMRPPPPALELKEEPASPPPERRPEEAPAPSVPAPPEGPPASREVQERARVQAISAGGASSLSVQGESENEAKGGARPAGETREDDSRRDEGGDRAREPEAREPGRAQRVVGALPGGSAGVPGGRLDLAGAGSEPYQLSLLRGKTNISIVLDGELSVAAPGYSCTLILPEEEQEAGRLEGETGEAPPRVTSLFDWAGRIGEGVGKNACAQGKAPGSAPQPEEGRIRKVYPGPAPEWIEQCRERLLQGREGEDRLLLREPAGSIVVLHPFPEGKDQDLSNLSLALVVALRQMVQETHREDLEAACGALPRELLP